MTPPTEALPTFLAEPSKIGEEISVTGKWVPKKPSGLFKKTADSDQMRELWDELQAAARSDSGILMSEINHGVGADAVLVHQIFEDSDALVRYLSTAVSSSLGALADVAEPQQHLVRGLNIPEPARQAISASGVPASFGQFLFGYVKNGYQRPDPQTAINVTAKWTCEPGDASLLEDLKYWWQRVGTEAHSIEDGLVRFEAYQVVGEDALIIHETFEDSDELKFHLSKGTAEKYKKDIDEVATPECYFFRGPVAWMIRTYSKFLRLPATYSRQASIHTRPGGSMSDGTAAELP